MITKIKSINNFAVFNNFQWDKCVKENDAPLSFGKLNILYGRNYSGKTTLSRIVRALETRTLPDKYANPQFEVVLSDGTQISQASIASSTIGIRVFNEDFVKTNLRFLIDSESEIMPFAILGADNEKIEKTIYELEIEIGSDTTGQETGFHKLLLIDKTTKWKAERAYSVACETLERKLKAKATNNPSGIKYNADRYGDQNYNIAKLRKDIDTINTQGYTNLTHQQKTEHEKMIKEEMKPPIPKIQIPNLQLKAFCDEAVELLSREIGSSNKIAELLRDAALNKWVEEGKTLHEGKNVCAFCGNSIDGKRWKEINAHFDEESEKLKSEIDALLLKVKSEKEQIQRPMNIDKSVFFVQYHAKIDAFVSAYENFVFEYCTSLDSIVKQLQARKEQITVSVIFAAPKSNVDSLRKQFEDFEKTRLESEAFSSKLGKAKESAQKALRLQEVADFCDTIRYASEISTLSSLKTEAVAADTALRKTESLLLSKLQKVQSLKRELNDEEEGAKRVNEYLNNYFGHNFVKLQAEEVNEGDKRIRFRIMRGDDPAYNLSQGECSLIAFCYFMAKLKDIDTVDKKPIIWIDDPISSLDNNHVFFTYSLLRTEIIEQKKYEQLFISTHNLDFLKYLKRLTGKDKDKNMNYFVVQRYDMSSVIKQMPKYLQNYVTEFNYLFHEIYKCSIIKSIDDNNYTHFYNFGNNARKFLEILMYYNYPDETKHLDKLEKFFGVDRIPAVLTDRINNEYSHLAGIFERGEIPTEVPEMLTTAQLIIDTLKLKNTDQYYALLSSVGEVEDLTAI